MQILSDEQLEEISERIRKGEPASLPEVLAAIRYQEGLARLRRAEKAKRRAALLWNLVWLVIGLGLLGLAILGHGSVDPLH